jgi:hypothetical protein
MLLEFAQERRSSGPLSFRERASVRRTVVDAPSNFDARSNRPSHRPSPGGRGRIGGGLWVAVVLAGSLVGADLQATGADDLAGQVRKLVRELDAQQLSQRDEAEQGLLRLGPKALDFLPQTVAPENAETAQRVARIRQRLQRQRAQSAIEPSRVTLRGTMPLENILAAVQDQTGNRIDASRLSAGGLLKQQLAVDFHETPFWQALDRLMAEARLDFYPYGDRQTVRLVIRSHEPSSTRRLSYAGPFRFEAQSVMAQRDLRWPDNRLLRLEVEVAWEPRLTPITFQQRMADVQAVDDRGNPLAVESRDAVLEIPVPRGPVAKRFSLGLALPPREVRSIASLHGTLGAVVPGGLETFRFDNLQTAKDLSKRAAGVTVVLEGASRSEKSTEVRLLVRFDQAGDALASHRTWIFSNPVHLLRPGGKPIAPDSVTPTRQSASEVGLALDFPVEGPVEGYTLEYRTPGAIFSMPLTYEFRDIPLP